MKICSLIVSGFLCVSHLIAADDLLVADFEQETYGAWTTTGEAFGPGPAKGTLEGQMKVSGFKGKRLVNSFFKKDASTGTLTSPPIKIERSFLTFLVGGGGHPDKTCMNLLLDGQVVRTVTGPNTASGGSEALELGLWDVKDLKGKMVAFQVVDDARGGWGHINIDHIVQTDTKPKVIAFTSMEKSFTVENTYLILPIQNKGAKGGRLRLSIDGEVVRDYGLVCVFHH
jgi:fructan beta-fructosidase